MATLGCGLMAGVFFAFSSFVMKALARIPQGEGIAAMQSINVAVISFWFMLVFLGTAAACAFLAVVSFLRLEESASVYRLAGGLLYLVGTVLVTLVFNVPRNNALAKLSRADPKGSALWPQYLSKCRLEPCAHPCRARGSRLPCSRAMNPQGAKATTA
jgi:uncharacterized membrane protein